MKIKVTSDSTCDLSPDIIEKYSIGILPLYIVKDGKSYKDTLEITPQDIFDHVEKTGNPCSTTAVNVAEYHTYFSDILKDFDAIIHFTISSEMSICYQNASLVAEELGNIYVIDSRNLSTGIGHLVMDAAILAAEGKLTPAEIADEINRRKAKLDVSFVIDTLKYLHKGGRCSAVAALGANLLSLKPCIEVVDGKMGVGKKYRGTLEKCLHNYIDDRLKSRDDVDFRRIFITHSGVADETIVEIKAMVESCGDFEEIIITRAGCTVSNHCGPNTLGVLFYRK